MKINGYMVGELLAETDTFRLYECVFPDGRIGLLKVAVTVDENPALDREALILRTMQEEAERLAGQVAETDRGKVNYQTAFPRLVESFECVEQDGRRINILDLSHSGEKLGDLVPLVFITTRHRLRVDPKTSVWIMGKLLKLLAWTHGLGISSGAVDSGNVFINRDWHLVALLHWSGGQLHDADGVPEYVAREEISQAAKAVIALLGGDPETGEIPEDDQLPDNRYARLLYAFAQGEESDAAAAHREFYELVYAQWGKQYHPYTGYPLDGREETETETDTE